MSQSSHRSRARTGHTLIEMVLSLSLLTVVMVSAGSAMMFAARATPDADSAGTTIITDSAALGQIAEDIALAKYVFELKANAVTVIVPDRTGDGVPDRIRYAWAGNAGDPLTYQLNSDAAVTLIDSVETFTLGYTLSASTYSIPPAFVYGAERLVARFDANVSGGDEQVSSSNWYGQAITSPTLSADAIGFRPTRADLYAGWTNPKDGQADVTLRERSGNLPGGISYAKFTMLESSLSGATFWETRDFTSTSTVPAGQDLALTLTFTGGSGSVLGIRSNSSGSGMLRSSDSGSTWGVDSGKTLVYRLYGQEVSLSGSSYEMRRSHLSLVTVGLLSTGKKRSPLSRQVRMLLAPELVAGLWEVDFNADPTKLNINFDGTVDWSYSAGDFPAGDLSNGVWTANGTIMMLPAVVLGEVIKAEMRLNADAGQATVYGPIYAYGNAVALPLITTLKSDGSGGQTLTIYSGYSTADTPAATFTGLDGGWIDLQLVLLPAEDRLWVLVNGDSLGSVALRRQADQGARGFWVQGVGAKFSEVRVTYGGSYTTIEDRGGLIEDLLDGVLGGLGL